MINVSAVVEFDEGSVTINKERYTDWNLGWKKLEKILCEGQKRNKQQSFAEKVLQSEIPKQYVADDYEWLKCNTNPRKTASIFSVQEQMVETKAWKLIRGLVNEDKCRLCGDLRETVQHLLSGCKKLAGSAYVKRHDNALKVLAVKWAIENRLIPEDTKWYNIKWERGQVIESNGKKLLWDWEYRMRINCIARRPDLTLEDKDKKLIMLIDMACLNEANKEAKRDEKIRKYQQFCFELRERRGYMVKMIPLVIGCLGGGMGELKTSIKRIFDSITENELNKVAREMQKTVLWESESIIRKTLSGLLI